MTALTVRLADGIYEQLRKAAASMGVSINELVQEAVTARLDDSTVTLVARNANQATRLRRLAREHGSIGMPFPNNEYPEWQVTDRTTDEPVNVHDVPSVGVGVKSVFGGEAECGYPLGHVTGRHGLCPRCGG